MSSKPTISQLRKLTAAVDDAAKQAEQIVEPARDEALQEARRLWHDRSSALDGETARRELAEIIENAADAMALNPETAIQSIGQYISRITQRVTASQATKGDVIWELFANDARSMPEQRQKLCTALVLASRGEIDPGLATFSREWWQNIERYKIENLAAWMDETAFRKWQNKDEKRAAEFDEADALISQLEKDRGTLNRINSETV